MISSIYRVKSLLHAYQNGVLTLRYLIILSHMGNHKELLSLGITNGLRDLNTRGKSLTELLKKSPLAVKLQAKSMIPNSRLVSVASF